MQLFAPKSRITVLVGHYGSGKTEIALSLAMAAGNSGQRVSLVDLDIVNPYFRSAEQADLLKQHNVDVVMPVFALSTVDIPALPAQVLSIFEDKSKRVIMDVGGDDTGAVALGQYKPHFARDDVEMLYVVNPNRPMSNSLSSIVGLMERIKGRARLLPAGLIANGNVGGYTAPGDIEKGLSLLYEVSRHTGVPVVAVAGTREVLNGFENNHDLPAIVVHRLLKPEWMED